jgi:hypothetical protein
VTRDRAFFLGILAVLLAVGVWTAVARGRVVPEAEVAGRPIQVPADGYVSSQACQACHPSQYASWHRSYHRTMTQVATPETVAARYDDVLEERDGKLWAQSSQVVLTTGSHHQQIFWYATGNSRVMGQLPVIWLTADQKWIPRRAALMAPPSSHAMPETGAWNGICVACHTTNGRPAFDTPFGSQAIATQTADTNATEFGIACESCHGPAADHAARNRSPLRRYSLHFTGARDETIVQP